LSHALISKDYFFFFLNSGLKNLFPFALFL
jgi:hypothetical protein